MDVFVRLLNTASGMEFTEEEFIRTGERIWNMERLINLGAGLTKEDDNLPGRCFDTLPLGDGVTRMSEEDFKYMLEDYYRVRGWDEEGVPTAEKLKSLGIG